MEDESYTLAMRWVQLGRIKAERSCRTCRRVRHGPVLCAFIRPQGRVTACDKTQVLAGRPWEQQLGSPSRRSSRWACDGPRASPLRHWTLVIVSRTQACARIGTEPEFNLHFDRERQEGTTLIDTMPKRRVLVWVEQSCQAA